MRLIIVLSFVSIEFTFAKDILFPSEYEELLQNEKYDKFLEDCLDQEMMPYQDPISGNFSCYPLLEQGPCNANEWFVLVKNSTNFDAHCKKRPCENDINELVLFNGECEIVGGPKQVCSDKTMQLFPNPYGEGKSSFNKHLPARYFRLTGRALENYNRSLPLL